MKDNHRLTIFRSLFILILLFVFNTIAAQGSLNMLNSRSNFWQNVQFGGGIGLNFSSGYTDVFLAPSAIYNINPVVAVGAGLNLNYVTSKNYFSSAIYGVNTLVLVNPIPQIQFSATLNESRVNYKEEGYSGYSENYWNTSLILGIGYRTGNVTVGVGYNVLKNDRYDTDPVVPFVRVYF